MFAGSAMNPFRWLLSIFRTKRDEVFTAEQPDNHVRHSFVPNPPPAVPEAREGNSSDLILSAGLRTRALQDDRRPPADIWEEIRQHVFQKDGMRCQVTGCINSGAGLECHHITPVAQGGGHMIDNLVTLCLFHHACQEDHDVRSMQERADTNRFCIKPPYWRLGKRIGCSIVRRSLATVNDLKQAKALYDLRCHCGSADWVGFLRPRFDDLVVLCPSCMKGWHLPLGVREETCVALAHFLQAHANIGRFSIHNFSADMVGLRMTARAIQACPDCFGEDKRCGYLVPRRKIRRLGMQCINASDSRFRCHFKTYC